MPTASLKADATITERVARGAAFLDKQEPGWWQRIDLDRLDLHSQCRCVLGQLATDLHEAGLDNPTWSEVVRRFGLRRWTCHRDGDLVEGTEVALGFNAGGQQEDEAYEALTAEWKRLIGERRAAA